MKTLAYVRVSTGGQDLGQQKLAILDYARRHRIRVRDFVETQSSALRMAQKEQLLSLIDALQKGDRLLVSNSRSANNTPHYQELPPSVSAQSAVPGTVRQPGIKLRNPVPGLSLAR
jgi:Resolvase, N terminal domain